MRERSVKQVSDHETRIGGERSERSALQTPGNTERETSFFFHSVTRIYILLLLLSSFTHTRAYASAHARRRPCERGVGKEGRKPGRVRRPATSRTLAHVGAACGVGPVVRPTAPSPHVATLGPTARLPEWQRERQPASEPIGTTRQSRQGGGCGNSRQPRDSLFRLSESPIGPADCRLARCNPPAPTWAVPPPSPRPACTSTGTARARPASSRPAACG